MPPTWLILRINIGQPLHLSPFSCCLRRGFGTDYQSTSVSMFRSFVSDHWSHSGHLFQGSLISTSIPRVPEGRFQPYICCDVSFINLSCLHTLELYSHNPAILLRKNVLVRLAPVCPTALKADLLKSGGNPDVHANTHANTHANQPPTYSLFHSSLTQDSRIAIYRHTEEAPGPQSTTSQNSNKLGLLLLSLTVAPERLDEPETGDCKARLGLLDEGGR